MPVGEKENQMDQLEQFLPNIGRSPFMIQVGGGNGPTFQRNVTGKGEFLLLSQSLFGAKCLQ